VDPDVAKPLAVVLLCEVGLGFVCFDLYNYVAEVSEGEDLLFLLRTCQEHWEKEQENCDY